MEKGNAERPSSRIPHSLCFAVLYVAGRGLRLAAVSGLLADVGEDAAVNVEDVAIDEV